MQRGLTIKVFRADLLFNVIDILHFKREIGVVSSKVINNLLRSDPSCYLRLNVPVV